MKQLSICHDWKSTVSDHQVQNLKDHDNSNGLISLVMRLVSSIGSIISLVLIVYGALKMFKDEPRLGATSLFLVGIAGLLSVLCVVLFGKKSRVSKITGEQYQEHIYSQRARRLARRGLIIIPLSLSAVFGAWYYFRTLPSDKTIVLVAEFDGPEPKKYRVTENIIRRLREATEKYDDISIEALNEVITEQDGREVARKKGKNKKASIVLWGWYAATGVQAEISPYFELLMKPVDQEFKIKQQPFSAPINELETFTMQTRLSVGVSSIVLATMGLASYSRGGYRTSISFFSDALSDQSMLLENWRATLYFYRANVHFDIGDYDRAISDNTMASDLDPDFASAYFNRANAYAIKKLYKEAIADYDQAIKKRPNHANAHYGRGFAYYCLGNHDEAMRSFDTSASIDSNNVGVFVGRGQIYHDKGEYDRAIKEYDRGIRAAPNWAQLYNSRGNVYRANGEYKRAISDFDHAIRLMPSYAKAYFSRGLTYYELKDFDHAISDFDSTIKWNPSWADAYHNLGTAFAHKGEFQQAVWGYTEAIKRNPVDVDAYASRAFAYSQIGQRTLAIADYQRFLEFSKDSVMRRSVEIELQELRNDTTFIK